MSCPKASLLLFFSVDIIDSTAFKQQHINSNNSSVSWIRDFKDFYTSYKVLVQESYQKLDDTAYLNDENFRFPFVWKFLGDELVFVVEILEFKHVISHLEAFKKALSTYNNNTNKKLKIKLSSWLAGFPVVNAIIGEVMINNTDEEKNKKEIIENKSIDFIGPSIDLGFRISKYSTIRKSVISVDLAYIILDFCITNKIQPFHFYFDKKQEAKGLVKNEYPIIWIDNFNGHSPIEDELYGIVRKDSSYELLRTYCMEYITNKSYKLMKPFTEIDNKFKPSNYEEELTTICREIYWDSLQIDESIEDSTASISDIDEIKKKILQTITEL